MTKISNDVAYPVQQTIGVNDTLLGSSSSMGEATVQFAPNAIATFISQNQNASFQYNYSDGSDADVDATTPSFFESRDVLNDITTDPTMVSQFRVNDINGSGFDLSELYNILATNPTSVLLQVQGVTDPNVIGVYTINSIVDNGNEFLINVNLPPIYSSIPPDGEFVHHDVYNLFYVPFVQPVEGAVLFGNYTIYKADGNTDLGNLEVGDIAQGFFSNVLYFKAAVFNGGDPTILGNWTQIDSIIFP